jgi:hypothetical protein
LVLLLERPVPAAVLVPVEVWIVGAAEVLWLRQVWVPAPGPWLLV